MLNSPSSRVRRARSACCRSSRWYSRSASHSSRIRSASSRSRSSRSLRRRSSSSRRSASRRLISHSMPSSRTMICRFHSMHSSSRSGAEALMTRVSTTRIWSVASCDRLSHRACARSFCRSCSPRRSCSSFISCLCRASSARECPVW